MPTIRLLLLSDTHDNAFPSISELQLPNQKIDVLLHCGDLTMIGGLSNYRAISNLLSIPAELRLVIPANHDVSLDPKRGTENLIEDEDDPEEHTNARELFDDARDKGVILLDEGVHRFTLKSGDQFNKGEGRMEDVDIVMTHGPPGFHSLAGYKGGWRLDSGREGEHRGCEKLFTAVERVRSLVHCFGHIHEGYGVERVGWEGREVGGAQGVDYGVMKVNGGNRGTRTLFVNAAVMRHGEKERNKPWVVDLEV